MPPVRKKVTAPPRTTGTPPFGAHVSVAGGLVTALGRGVRIGAEVIQIFSKQNTRWMGKALEEEEAGAFREESARVGIPTVAIHCAYLINLASAKETVRTRSLYALEDEVSRAAMLGVPYLVMHPGSSGEDPEETGEERIFQALRVFGRLPRGVTLLLENTAGQGNSIGRTTEQLRRLIDGCGAPPDVAVCLDSAHLFEAGYDIAEEEGWEGLLEELAGNGILPLVRMWHLNDSKTALGSRVDRHFHIGEGKIGLPGFRRIVTHPEFRKLPMVLETPKDGEDEFERDRQNLAALRNLCAAADGE
ncbi:MAG TPA: deoxyribonuclease IV [Candidatus Deferrimicrobiaceae bacterium]|nr:deoxyribonuclease IV [Candidatus Deferrimicrobiaceae bacterium]